MHASYVDDSRSERTNGDESETLSEISDYIGGGYGGGKETTTNPLSVSQMMATEDIDGAPISYATHSEQVVYPELGSKAPNPSKPTSKLTGLSSSLLSTATATTSSSVKRPLSAGRTGMRGSSIGTGTGVSSSSISGIGGINSRTPYGSSTNLPDRLSSSSLGRSNLPVASTTSNTSTTSTTIRRTSLGNRTSSGGGGGSSSGSSKSTK